MKLGFTCLDYQDGDFSMSNLKTIIPGVLALALGVSACMEPGPIRGSIHSNSYKLRLGMTVEDVERIIGEATYTRVHPKNALIVCRTYLYDEEVGAKFVHVKFEDNLVVGASDGHRKVCNLKNVT